jgi:hypothetical protein
MKKIFIIILFLVPFLSFPYGWNTYYFDNEEYTGGPTSIKLDSNGYPHISYCFYGNGDDLKYAYFDGNNWHVERVDSEGDVGYSNSLALDKNNHPHISYEGGNGLKYAYYDGTKWNIEIVDNSIWGNDFETSITLDSKDRPHISYFDGQYSDLRHAYFDGTKWNIEIVDSAGNVGWCSSIAIDSKDHIYISYDDETNMALKIAYWTGTGWKIGIVDNEKYTGRGTSIALDSNERPHIAYDGPNNIKHAYWNGSNWVIEVIEDGDENKYPADPSISINSKNIPCVAYCYIDKINNIFYIKYAYKENDKWNYAIVDDKDGYPYLSLDSNDNPHISYEAFPFIKYAWYEGPYPGIDLTSFSAKANNDTITLNWAISTDENISGFNLYRRVVTPGAIHELPLQYPPVRENAHSPIQSEDNYVWTKVNTSFITGTNPYSYTDKNVKFETKYEYKLEAVVSDKNDTLGTTQVTSDNSTPSPFDIARIYPTPADDRISIDIVIPEQTDIDISIYDITGRKVATVVSGLYNPGEYTMLSDVSGLINGVYIVRMTADKFSASKNFIVAR